MKKLILSSLILLLMVVYQVKGIQPGDPNQEVTATLKSSSRLFAIKEDITSVILIIPSGSVVTVTGSDSTYFKVKFEESEGYIFRRHAEINVAPKTVSTTTQPQNFKQMEQSAEQKQVNRFTYLESKYGTNMATRLFSGKIWKGMTSEMVKDSWGAPLKINRVIDDVVKEEWIYNNSWLYIENNTLVQWGPVRK